MRGDIPIGQTIETGENKNDLAGLCSEIIGSGRTPSPKDTRDRCMSQRTY